MAESQFVDSRQGSDLTSAGDRRGRWGQMEEWDVYYLFVRNINVTTNGYWLVLWLHCWSYRSWEPVEPGEREVATQCLSENE